VLGFSVHGWKALKICFFYFCTVTRKSLKEKKRNPTFYEIVFPHLEEETFVEEFRVSRDLFMWLVLILSPVVLFPDVADREGI
jgi:hypothetical protein